MVHLDKAKYLKEYNNLNLAYLQLTVMTKKQKACNHYDYRLLMAESQGFEPWVRLRTQHFECCTIDHSDNSPYFIL